MNSDDQGTRQQAAGASSNEPYTTTLATTYMDIIHTKLTQRLICMYNNPIHN